jgi:hypothetical protein
VPTLSTINGGTSERLAAKPDAYPRAVAVRGALGLEEKGKILPRKAVPAG